MLESTIVVIFPIEKQYDNSTIFPPTGAFVNREVPGEHFIHFFFSRLTSGLLMFGRSPAKAKDIETQIRYYITQYFTLFYIDNSTLTYI